MGNLGAQKEKRNDTPISAKKDIMGDKTVRVRADSVSYTHLDVYKRQHSESPFSLIHKIRIPF